MEFCLLRPVFPRLVAGLCLAASLLTAGLYAQNPPPPKPAAAPEAPPEVRILARSQERVAERVYAAGDVEIHYGQFLLFADRVEYNLETKDVTAEGNVVAQSGGEVIRAERIFTNLETGRATIDRASGLIQPFVLFEAESLERRQADLYGLKKARLTACTQPNPRWSFGLSKANLKTDDYIEMWDAVLRVKSVPVFYLPEGGPALTIVVSDAGARPLSKAPVVLFSRNAASPRSFFGKTDSAGMYRFDAVPPGAYNLTVTAPDNRTRQKTVSVTLNEGEARTLTVSFDSRVKVSGTARGAGEAYQGLLVFGLRAEVSAMQFARSDAAGGYAVELEPGEYIVTRSGVPGNAVIIVPPGPTATIDVNFR